MLDGVPVQSPRQSHENVCLTSVLVTILPDKEWYVYLPSNIKIELFIYVAGFRSRISAILGGATGNIVASVI